MGFDAGGTMVRRGANHPEGLRRVRAPPDTNA